MILQINPNWQRPSLIKLPKRYYQIFQMFRTAKCTECKRTPKDPAICLICGQFVCFREICCSHNSVFESVAVSLNLLIYFYCSHKPIHFGFNSNLLNINEVLLGYIRIKFSHKKRKFVFQFQ